MASEIHAEIVAGEIVNAVLEEADPVLVTEEDALLNLRSPYQVGELSVKAARNDFEMQHVTLTKHNDERS